MSATWLLIAGCAAESDHPVQDGAEPPVAVQSASLCAATDDLDSMCDGVDEDCDGTLDEDCDFGPSNCPIGSHIIGGTAGDDVLVGGIGRDCILGYGGNDILYGGNGNDVLAGGPGDDILQGGNGRDQLLGGPGADALLGGNGDDALTGGSGNDVLSGGNGSDTASGGDGHDMIHGGSGPDVLDGGSGADWIIGGAGADVISGGSGPDVCDVGSGCESTAGSATFCAADADCPSPQRCVPNVHYCASPDQVAFDDPTCDGVDDDSDGALDEDYAPTATSCGVGACSAAGQLSCVGGALVDACAPGTPAPSDASCDGVDDDCNGAADDGYVASATSCGVGACSAGGQLSCVGGALVDTCAPGTPAPTDASCDGVDDDCNGAADDGYVASATTCGVGACSAAGQLSCVGGAIVDTCAPGTPAPSDASCDGVDDDCNGAADDGYVASATSCGVGACSAAGQLSCVGGALVDTCAPPPDGTTCDAPGAAIAECAAGVCEVLTCTAPLGDCDGSSANGCEADLDTSVENCGGCGTACASGEACNAGACGDGASGDPPGIGAGVKHTCAVMEDGRVQCWGDNSSGQCGDGTASNDRLTPVFVTGLADAVAVDGGSEFTCALRVTGQVACWGRNNVGQLGDGSFISSLVPTMVSGITDAVQVSAGATHACATRTNGTVMCWGLRSSGQLGDGSSFGNSPLPVQVLDLVDAVSVSAGQGHTCAIRAGGGLACWGLNSMCQVGDGTLTNRNRPVFLTTPTGIVGAALGSGHTCALNGSGSVFCWGANGTGALGGGFVSTRTCSPVSVLNLTDAVDISVSLAANRAHSCAVRATGAVACWGSNDVGQLGNGTTTGSSSPVAVLEITNAVMVAAGNAHTCVSLDDGAVACWGLSNEGQVGDGSLSTRLDPETTLLLP